MPAPVAAGGGVPAGAGSSGCASGSATICGVVGGRTDVTKTLASSSISISPVSSIVEDGSGASSAGANVSSVAGASSGGAAAVVSGGGSGGAVGRSSDSRDNALKTLRHRPQRT